MRQWTLMILVAAWAALAGAGAAGADAETAVLTVETPWRFYVVPKPGAGRPKAAPAAEWAARPFDDSAWPSHTGPVFGGYGYDRMADQVGVLLVQGRFRVADPRGVRRLALVVVYRGGVVVAVNGREIGRGHLPRGPLGPLSEAAGYPREAYVRPDADVLLPNYGSRTPPEEVRGRYEGRLRRLRVEVPPEVLRAGVNVLALRIHHAAEPVGLPEGRATLRWGTAGLVDLTLRGEPEAAFRGGAAARAGGVRLWNAEACQAIDPEAPGASRLEQVRPIRLDVPRGGVASGQVVAEGDGPLAGLAAEVGPLVGPGGATLPASAVRVRYARLGGKYVGLFDRPQQGARVQPVWVTVEPAADAAPGAYAGTLRVRTAGGVREVPLEVRVHGWQAGPPSAWATCINVLQSPESVAGHYGVGLWSDRHFELMAASMRLMGELGNDVLGVGAVGKSVFGDDPLVVFRREGGRLEPDFRFLDRYLALYDRHAHAPRFLSVHVWNYGMYYKGYGRDGKAGRDVPDGAAQRAETIPIQVLEGGRVRAAEMPIFGEPGTEAVWKAVLDGVRARVKALGWTETRMLLGTSGDTWPSAETVAFFQGFAPEVEWRVLTHGCGCPHWGRTRFERTQPNGMVVGYLEIARRVGNSRPPLADHPVPCNCRDKVGHHASTYRDLVPLTTVAVGYDGICWKGIDYWSYETAEGTRRSALNTYVHFGNMVGGTPRAMAVAGPDGAVATVQTEMFREGTLACEAVLAVRRELGRLYPRPMKTYDAATVRLHDALTRILVDRETGKQTVAGPRALDLTLRYADGRVQPPVDGKSPTFNTARHTGTATPAGDGAIDLAVEVNDDAWVKGGTGTYRVTLRREGRTLTGTYTGRFTDRQGRTADVRGKVTGVFEAGVLTEPAGPPPPKDDRYREAEAAVEALIACVEKGGDWAGSVARLYEVAGDLAAAEK